MAEPGMIRDLFLQAAMILATVFMFLYMHNIPQRVLSKFNNFRHNNPAATKAKRHFVIGAQLLSKARSVLSKDPLASASLAKSAAEEADKSISLDPKDAAAHILKALALELQGFKTSALDSLDAALSPLTAKSMSDHERADALLKRAELKLAVNRDGRVDSAVLDLVESVSLKDDNCRSFYLLGECYEKQEKVEEAKKAYQSAMKIEPEFNKAKDALDRLGS